MSCQGTKTSKAEGGLNARGVPHSKDAVKLWLQRRVPICGEEAIQNALRLDVIQRHALVLWHHVPVVLQHGL